MGAGAALAFGARRAARALHQCSTFTSIYPVFGVFLILFRWYWYVVCESGMRVLDSCSGQPLEVHLKKTKEVAVFTSAHSLQEFTERASCRWKATGRRVSGWTSRAWASVRGACVSAMSSQPKPQLSLHTRARRVPRGASARRRRLCLLVEPLPPDGGLDGSGGTARQTAQEARPWPGVSAC